MQSTRELNDIMQFEHVIKVENGEVTDKIVANLYAPECYHEGFADGADIEAGTGWELVDGFSGQYRYSGPIMHASEYVGGGLERHILENDGYYVTVVCEVLNCDEDCDQPCGGDHEPAGWAVAYRPLES